MIFYGSQEVMRQWSDAVSYVEHMLYEQLFAAIGQEQLSGA